jgi:methionyl-tRNA formyltransferase
MHKVALIGSVTSSFATLKKLVEHNWNIVGVFGYEPDNTAKVSGYAKMGEYCGEKNIPYFAFKKINDNSIKLILEGLQPDLVFAVGISQILSEDIIRIAKVGNIGFHPTLLPKGRGRAPIAWLILEEQYGAANFFLITEGVDDGPVFVQKKFEVTPRDNASTIEEKILLSIDTALDEWLPKLKQGLWDPIVQDHEKASYYGKRDQDDGLIDWSETADQIDRLIRASAPPHPGAYSFLKAEKIWIMTSRIEEGINIKGVKGSVLLKKGEEFLLQTGSGNVWISNIVDRSDQLVYLKVGDKLGYYPELEIFKLRQEILMIKQKLNL